MCVRWMKFVGSPIILRSIRLLLFFGGAFAITQQAILCQNSLMPALCCRPVGREREVEPATNPGTFSGPERVATAPQKVDACDKAGMCEEQAASRSTTGMFPRERRRVDVHVCRRLIERLAVALEVM